jgi:hypothetical protein
MRAKERTDRRMGLKLMALALCALASGPVRGAPPFDAAGLRALLVSRGFSSSQAQAAIAVLERAAARQLPVSVLEGRLREGLARSVAPVTILAVLDERDAGLVRADELARRSVSEGVGVRGRSESLARLADAFSMGVSPADVHGLVAAAARAGRDLDDVSRSAEVMGRLARLGFRPPDTRDVLQAALVEHWPRARLDGLVAVFVQARGQGLAPERTRELLVAGIHEGKEKAAPKPPARTPAPRTPAPRTPAPHTPAPHMQRVPVPRPPMPHR